MRLTTSLVLSTLCWAVQSAYAASAQVYSYDPQSQPGPNAQSRNLSPVEARLVLAQRIGVEDYHRSDLISEGVLKAINDFGVRTPLFADPSQLRKAFIFFAGDLLADAQESLKPFASFQITPAPEAEASRDLYIDLAKQSDGASFLDLRDDELAALLGRNLKVSSNGHSLYIAKSARDLKSLFQKLVDAQNFSVTALVVSSTSSGSNSNTVQTSSLHHSWGTYEMPGTQAQIHLQKRQQALTSSSSTPSAAAAPVSPLASSALPGILAACYTSASECESVTRNCTGHGSCKRKFHDASAPSGSQDCYACVCSATTSEDGKRTTQWAGPACQKKDVSVEFWLIALFSVGLVFLISFAIGSVWSMGSEPLPSVIGAGVSGPSARK